MEQWETCSSVEPRTDRYRYGLAWSKVKAGHILSASEDTTVAHWCVMLKTRLTAGM